MIYDCFTFFNEFDLLEIRLNYLNDYVDKFVLVEMNKTHSNQDKPFLFEENKDRYKKFLDKIIHIKVANCPPMPNPYDGSWFLENYQRDCIMLGLSHARSDDIIMISDVDEIPNVAAIQAYESGIMVIEHKIYLYYLNMFNKSCFWISGTRICHLSDLLEPNFEIVINASNMYTKKGLPTYLRFSCGPIFKNGGWHFSYMGGAEKVLYKLQSFAHQEYNNEYHANLDIIKRVIADRRDMYGRNYTYEPIPIDDSFPDYLVKNQDKYKHLIYPV